MAQNPPPRPDDASSASSPLRPTPSAAPAPNGSPLEDGHEDGPRQHVAPVDIHADVRERHEAEPLEHMQLVRGLRVQLRVVCVAQGVEAAEGRDGRERRGCHRGRGW